MRKWRWTAKSLPNLLGVNMRHSFQADAVCFEVLYQPQVFSAVSFAKSCTLNKDINLRQHRSITPSVSFLTADLTRPPSSGHPTKCSFQSRVWVRYVVALSILKSLSVASFHAIEGVPVAMVTTIHDMNQKPNLECNHKLQLIRSQHMYGMKWVKTKFKCKTVTRHCVWLFLQHCRLWMTSASSSILG